jgi:hypothetical protein
LARLRRRRRASKASCSVALLSELEMPEQELTRRAMYDLVWSRPMTRVAEDLGISDVALKRFVTSIGSPRPSAGIGLRYAGKPTKQIQFHSTSDPQHEHIVIHGSRNKWRQKFARFWSKSENAERPCLRRPRPPKHRQSRRRTCTRQSRHGPGHLASHRRSGLIFMLKYPTPLGPQASHLRATKVDFPES